MNESPTGRDGYILAKGQRIYHVYKQNFPMQFIYGLTPDDNRETAPNLIDVRTLPEEYRRLPVEVDWLKVPQRSMGKRLREQLSAHAIAFACALYDGYDLMAHIAREREVSEQEEADFRAKQDALIAQREAAGTCPDCGDPACTAPFGCIPF